MPIATDNPQAVTLDDEPDAPVVDERWRLEAPTGSDGPGILLKLYGGSLLIDVTSIEPEFHCDEVNLRIFPTLGSETGHPNSLRIDKAV